MKLAGMEIGMIIKKPGSASLGGSTQEACSLADSDREAVTDQVDALDGHRPQRAEVIGEREPTPSRIPVSGARQGVSLADLIPLEDVAKVLPKRLHLSTVFRWAQKGRKGVRLKVVSVGGTRCTTERWLFEFFEAVEEARAPQEPTRPPRPHPRPRRGGPRKPGRGKADPTTKETLRRHGLSLED